MENLLFLGVPILKHIRVLQKVFISLTFLMIYLQFDEFPVLKVYRVLFRVWSA